MTVYMTDMATGSAGGNVFLEICKIAKLETPELTYHDPNLWSRDFQQCV